MNNAYQAVPEEVNADFSQIVTVNMANSSYMKSPMKGVERILLDRIGGEKARATSIVRYAPGSYFSPHTHSGGEEFVVLEGVFQDEKGDYPAGTYVRNPPQSSHQPKSENGCIIFVKLWQFQADDRFSLTKALMPNSDSMAARNVENTLYEDEFERVSCVKLLEDLTYEKHKGIEVLVLNGQVSIATVHSNQADKSPLPKVLSKHDWQRRPIGDSCIISAVSNHENDSEPPLLWIKVNHLHDVNKQIERVTKS